MAEKANSGAKETEFMRVAIARGIFFPTAEVFSDNLGGFWEYGPTGLKIFNNILKEWRVLLEDSNAFEVSGAIILPRKVLQASGHEKNFTDPLVTCKKCGSVYRIDKMLEEKDPKEKFEALPSAEYSKLILKYKLKCEKCGGEFRDPTSFSLMIGANIGVAEEPNAYLRPEACQSIFLDFKRIFDTYAGKKLPLAIAQVGKAFRNEIAPRNNLLRQREFYQIDIEVFFADDNEFPLHHNDDIEIGIRDDKNPNVSRIKISEALESRIIEDNVTAYWTARWIKFLERLGFDSKDMRLRKLHEEKPFYAKEAFDLEIRREDDWIEVTGIHQRNDYDLSNYAKFGAPVPNVDGKIPSIFEISCGMDRLLYLLLYRSFNIDGERHWFALKDDIAPYGFGVFPLQKDGKLLAKAREVYSSMKANKINCYYSETGSIGKRYAKADEIGVPRCVTIDYTTLEDNTVTVRKRDNTKQSRIKFSEIT